MLAFNSAAGAQTAAAPAEPAAPTADNAVMLTIFLKHDQSRPLGELNAQLAKQGFYKAFPPAGVEVVSWYVFVGIGQVVTLRHLTPRGFARSTASSRPPPGAVSTAPNSTRPEQTFAPAMESAVGYTRALGAGAIRRLARFEHCRSRDWSRWIFRLHAARASYCGVDIDPLNVEGARRRLSPIEIRRGRYHHQRLRAEFGEIAPDTILCCNVIEHISDDRLFAVENMLRVLAPKGKLLRFVPALPVLFEPRRLAGFILAAIQNGRCARSRTRAGSRVSIISIPLAPWAGSPSTGSSATRIDSKSVAAQVDFFDQVLVPVSRITNRLTESHARPIPRGD